MRDAKRIARPRHALICIAKDAGLLIEGRGDGARFDLAMCRELADFGLALESDYRDIARSIAATRDARG